jgi:hypothetical protein
MKKLTLSHAAPSVPLCAWPGGHLTPYKDDFTTDQRSQETPDHTQDLQLVSSFTPLHTLTLFYTRGLGLVVLHVYSPGHEASASPRWN